MNDPVSTVHGRQQRAEPRERSVGIEVVVHGKGLAATASLADRSRSGCLLRVEGASDSWQGQTIEVRPAQEHGPALLMRVVRVAERSECGMLLGCRRVRATHEGDRGPSMRVHVRASQVARRAGR
jgi:hypothetical protein